MNGMRVLVNVYRALPASGGAGGAGKFLEALLTGLASRVQLRAIASESNRQCLPVARGLEYVMVSEESQAAFAQHFEWADIYYDPLNGLGPTLIPPRLPVAVAIMDLQHNVYPRFFAGGMYEARNRAYGFAIQRADGVITISEFERENIRRVYGVDHVYVVPLSGYTSEPDASGVVSLTARAKALGGGPYLIYPAIAWRHKNHFRLMEATGLAMRHAQDLRLILTGIEKHGSSSNLHMWKLVAEKLEDAVEAHGHLPQQEFALRLRGARGLVFPSLYEGFGIPVVEAMQMGIPVLTVRETAIPEVAGDAVMYFRDPRNSQAMSEDIRRFWSDGDLRSELTVRGLEQGARFSKAQFINDTVEALTVVRERHRSRAAAVSSSWRKPAYRETDSEQPLTAIVLIEARREAIWPAVESTRTALRSRYFDDMRLCFVLDRSAGENVLAAAFGARDEYALADIEDPDEVALAIRFFCESVVDSTYVVYTRSGHLLSASHDAVRVALRNLDYVDDVGCAVLDSANSGWAVVTPSVGEQEAVEIVDSIRPRRLAFFENLILRSRLLETAGPIGSLRLLSTFVRAVKYLSGPAA